jgi:hypothetical protein
MEKLLESGKAMKRLIWFSGMSCDWPIWLELGWDGMGCLQLGLDERHPEMHAGASRHARQ